MLNNFIQSNLLVSKNNIIIIIIHVNYITMYYVSLTHFFVKSATYVIKILCDIKISHRGSDFHMVINLVPTLFS